MVRWLKRIILSLLALALLLVCVAVGYGLIVHEPRPAIQASPEADVLARRVQDALGSDHWGAIGEISWRFGDRRTHRWRRCTDQVWVQWGDAEVRLDLGRGGGEVIAGGAADDQSLIDEAHKYFINDAFWLNPVRTFFDDGVSRAVVGLGDDVMAEFGAQHEALLVTYGQGGRTPGDAYLWLLDAEHRPVAWKMWVSIIPIGGLPVTWSDWQPVGAGLQIARSHRLPLGLTLEISQVTTRACDDNSL
ncbi:MAG: hypothetical protein ACE366_04885 [Bradymonadia bacterium]